jgi:hypothetical protein
VSNFLPRLLIRSDQHEKATISAHEIEPGMETELDWCLATGILVPAAPASELVCRNCASGSAESIVYLSSKDGRAIPYLPCAECGPVRIEPESLLRWQLDCGRLWEVICRDAKCDVQLREVVPGRLWRIGRSCWAGCNWDILGGCRLWQQDGGDILSLNRWTARSILFVPDRSPLPGTEGQRPLHLMVMRELMRRNGGRQLDVDQLETQLQGAAEQSPERKHRTIRKRASRAALIEVLVKHLKEHLDAAIDHARATSERGLAELLPRPSQRDLARLTGVAEMAVSRCLRDPAARELRLLWSTAGDLDQLLALPAVRAKARR